MLHNLLKMINCANFAAFVGAVMFLASSSAHDATLPVNPVLGVPGFPDCIQPSHIQEQSIRRSAMTLVCNQQARFAKSIKVGCVGDSITAGVHSSGGNHTYPAQLQILLDQKYGLGAYEVTNLGACGSTMLKNGNSPYWERPQYHTLTSNKWDIIVIMLGTNDAKDKSSGGPSNWDHLCGDASDLSKCAYLSDYSSMIDVVQGLGVRSSGPKIYSMIPPPLMQARAYGMNETVINQILPSIIPVVTKTKQIKGPIDVYRGMGGISDWRSKFPSNGCSTTNHAAWPPCTWWCDAQSCDQCHPDDAGYHQMAQIVISGLSL